MSEVRSVQNVVSKAARDVLAERQRQQSAEGWTPAHDDEHDDMSLGAAAACYAARHLMQVEMRMEDGTDDRRTVPAFWPASWGVRWWKPKGYRRNLVRAAALLIAEIERVDRLTLAKRDWKKEKAK